MLNIHPNLIKHHDCIVVAVSGGIDSMVLLHFLHELKTKLALKLVVAHVNHHTRTATASEEAFVKRMAALYDLPCETFDFQHDTQSNFHDYSRALRMDFFKEVARKHQCDKIALAHHANDLAETILMRLARGSGLSGYAGMQLETLADGFLLIRPFLYSAREEIVEYQKQYRIEYMEDESNQEDDYTRNRFRHHLIPFFHQENPTYTEKFAQFSTYVQEASQVIQKLAKEFISASVVLLPQEAKLPVLEFVKLESAVMREVLTQLIDFVSENSVEVSFAQLTELIRLSKDEKTKKEIDIDEFLIVCKSYDWLYFHKQKPSYPSYEFQIREFGELRLPGNSLFAVSENYSNLSGKTIELWYNDLDLIFPLTVRNRRPGDRISLPYGTKKLKDLFIEKKVPHALREEIPLVYSAQGQLLWIPSYYFSKQTTGRNRLFLAYSKG